MARNHNDAHTARQNSWHCEECREPLGKLQRKRWVVYDEDGGMVIIDRGCKLCPKCWHRNYFVSPLS